MPKNCRALLKRLPKLAEELVGADVLIPRRINELLSNAAFWAHWVIARSSTSRTPPAISNARSCARHGGCASAGPVSLFGIVAAGTTRQRLYAANRETAMDTDHKRPWDGIISEEEQRAYRAAGFGRPGGIGSRPALLIIDVQYRTVGTTPMPFWEAIKEFPTSCGEVGWGAVRLYPAPARGVPPARLAGPVPACRAEAGDRWRPPRRAGFPPS